jgi:hypothetical protein
MPEPTITIELTEEQRHAVVGALYDKLGETDRYLLTFAHDGDEPGALDSCCNAHLARYKERISQRDALRGQKALFVRLIEIIDGAQPSSWSNTVPRALAEALTDREDAESCHAAAWLAEHENDDELWDLLGKLMDRITELADPA